jgi:hypothetical protein
MVTSLTSLRLLSGIFFKTEIISFELVPFTEATNVFFLFFPDLSVKKVLSSHLESATSSMLKCSPVLSGYIKYSSACSR